MPSTVTGRASQGSRRAVAGYLRKSAHEVRVKAGLWVAVPFLWIFSYRCYNMCTAAASCQLHSSLVHVT